MDFKFLQRKHEQQTTLLDHFSGLHRPARLQFNFALLPYYAKTFNANQTTTGILIASYALMQLISAPILGRLSDRFGRRPVLLVSVFGTFLGFLLLGFANALWMLFASRIIDGLTGGNLSVAQAYISDVTNAKDRSKGLGMIGVAFGLGFIIGPVTGGLLSQWGYAVPAFAAATISFINLILIYAWLPESLTEEKRSQMTEKRPAITLNALLVAFQRPFTGSILTPASSLVSPSRYSKPSSRYMRLQNLISPRATQA